MPKQANYKSRFSVLEDLEDSGMGQNKSQKESDCPWRADVGEKQKRIYGDSLRQNNGGQHFNG